MTEGILSDFKRIQELDNGAVLSEWKDIIRKDRNSGYGLFEYVKQTPIEQMDGMLGFIAISSLVTVMEKHQVEPFPELLEKVERSYKLTGLEEEGLSVAQKALRIANHFRIIFYS